MSVFRDNILDGRVALVTGGATGIGATIARTLAAHGAAVAIASRNEERLAAARAALEADGLTCCVARCDVREPAEVEAALASILERFGRIDIVVNNAAGNFPAALKDLSYNGFRTVVDIDLNGTFNVTRAAFDAWLGEHGGSIINITAAIQYTGMPLQGHVAAAKAGIDALMRTSAVEWGPLGIRVNGVAPGAIGDTEGMRRIVGGRAEERICRGIPLRRLGRRQDIADAVLFLASDAAAYINGDIIVVDGGAWLDNSTGT